MISRRLFQPKVFLNSVTLDFRISGVMLVQGSVKMVVLGGCFHSKSAQGSWLMSRTISMM